MTGNATPTSGTAKKSRSITKQPTSKEKKMKEFWVLFGKNPEVIATRITAFAETIDAVREAFPDADRIMEIV